MKTDPGLDAVRQARTEISREFGNDPARLIAHYIQMQAAYTGGPIVAGPEDSAAAPDVARNEHRPTQR